MGVDYGLGLVIGFQFPEQEVLEKYTKTLPGFNQSISEYDGKTGEKVIKEVEVFPSFTVFELNGKRYIDAGEAEDIPESITKDMGDEYDFRQALERYVGCLIHESGDYCGERDNGTLSFCPRVTENHDVVEVGRLTVGPSVNFALAVRLKKKLDILGKKLKKLGFKVPKPTIHMVWGAG